MVSPSRYRHGVSGDHLAPVVVVPARVAAVLHRLTALDRVRLEHRGADEELDAVLAAMAAADRWWRSSVGGTHRDGAGSESASSGHGSYRAATWSTSEVAAAAGISERAVRRAAAEARLPGRRIGRTWLFDPVDVRTWREARSA